MRLLLVGAGITGDSNSIGGTTILFEDLVEYCGAQVSRVEVVRLNELGIFGSLNAIFSFCWSDGDVVVLNGNRNSAFVVGLFLAGLSYFTGHKNVLRMFGGNFLDLIDASLWRRYCFAIFSNKFQLFFFETRALVELVPQRYPRIREKVLQFPNSRRLPSVRKDLISLDKKLGRKRFVFCSAIKHDKGAGLLIDAFEEMPEFDLFFLGPVYMDDFHERIRPVKNLHYEGLVTPGDVCEALLEFDHLILPTQHAGEGIPGIIIEALQVGLPVISTRRPGIIEVVDEKCGTFIEEVSVQGIKEAISRARAKDYSDLSCSARLRGFEYGHDHVHDRFFKVLSSLSC